MTREPPSPALDLLVVGGLTIDRFADGSSAAGGSVIHVARAAAARGLRVGVLTSAGPEPGARAGLAELRSLTAFLEVTRRDSTTTFRHRESPDGRRLWLERRSGQVRLGADAHQRIITNAVLYAPIAGELGPEALTIWGDSWHPVAILQGWLRKLREGAEVEPITLSSLDASLVAALSTLDLLVASREDLLADAATPFDQLDVLRATFGRKPALLVTEGPAGAWLDVTGVRRDLDSREHVPAPWVVEGAETVGAGDVLAAFLSMPDEDPSATWMGRAMKAMRAVAEELEARKRR